MHLRRILRCAPELLALLLLLAAGPAVAKNVYRPTDVPEVLTLANDVTARPDQMVFEHRKNDTLAQEPTVLEDKEEEIECRDVHKYKDHCTFVRTHCANELVGIFNYLEFYYCKMDHLQPLAFIIILAWTGLLFFTVGTAASEFLAPNLSVIAGICGFSQSMAGVTFLAFGNGAADIFSTYSAMKINSGSLAIGELIGAASFIAAVVGGTVAILHPIKVGRRYGRKNYVRDIAFYVLAVTLGIVFLADGVIKLWECIVMICFYAVYIIYIFFERSWANRRKEARRKERHVREHYTAPEEEEELLQEDDVDEVVGGSPDALLGDSSRELSALENGDDADDADDEEEASQQAYAELINGMRVARPGVERRVTPQTIHGIRPSLLGAMEFRAVMNALEKHKNFRGRHIHMRRYSDDPFLHVGPYGQTRHSAPGELRPSQEDLLNMNDDGLDGTFDGNDRREAATPQSLLRPDKLNGRTRAVSVNDVRQNMSIDSDIENLRPLPTPILDLNDEQLDDTAETRQSTEVPRPLRIETTHLAPPSETSSGRPSPSTTPNRSPRVSPLGQEIPRFTFSDADETSARLCSSPQQRSSPVPSIRLPQPSMDELSIDTIVGEQGQAWRIFRWWPYSILPPPQQLLETFFPTVTGMFPDKSPLAKAISIFGVPAYFVLKLTVPVYQDNGASDGATKEIGYPPESPASTFTRTTSLPPTPSTPHAPELITEKREWNRWLVATHCMTGPLLITTAFFTPADNAMDLLKPTLYALLAGLILLLLLFSLTTTSHPPKLLKILAFGGFAVAIMWIQTVAEEVVGILKTFGVILGISDAILGLTVFAVGNSVGDFVANITVAGLGMNVMALSACFGGPMMNILLGVGFAGSWINTKRGKDYQIEVSSTLVISAGTLLATLLLLLILVPMNRWVMGPKIGWTLITLWTLSTIVNVVVEATGIGGTWGTGLHRGHQHG